MKRQIVCAAVFTGLIAPLVAGPVSKGVEFSAPVRLDVPDCKDLEGPEVVDFDGDGIRDLLSGVYAGNLLFRKNTGSNQSPKFAKPVNVQNLGKDIKLKHW